MYCAKNVLLGTKGKIVLGSHCGGGGVFLKKIAPPWVCVLHQQRCHHQNLFGFWAFRAYNDASTDSREPHIPLGQNNRHLLSLTRCVGPACPRLHVYHFLSLSPGHDYLVPPMQRGYRGQGAFSPSVQTSVNIDHRAVTWICSYLSECYYSESPASRGEH